MHPLSLSLQITSTVSLKKEVERFFTFLFFYFFTFTLSRWIDQTIMTDAVEQDWSNDHDWCSRDCCRKFVVEDSIPSEYILQIVLLVSSHFIYSIISYMCWHGDKVFASFRHHDIGFELGDFRHFWKQEKWYKMRKKLIDERGRHKTS